MAHGYDTMMNPAIEELLDGVASYACSCPQGYTGERCETYIGACTDFTCANGGTCIPGLGDDVSCDCPATWAGEFCEVDVTALDLHALVERRIVPGPSRIAEGILQVVFGPHQQVIGRAKLLVE